MNTLFTHALVVGGDTHRGRTLEGAVADAKDWAAVYAGLDQTLLTNPSQAAFLAAYESFARTLGRSGDFGVFVFCGPGGCQVNGHGQTEWLFGLDGADVVTERELTSILDAAFGCAWDPDNPPLGRVLTIADACSTGILLDGAGRRARAPSLAGATVRSLTPQARILPHVTDPAARRAPRFGGHSRVVMAADHVPSGERLRESFTVDNQTYGGRVMGDLTYHAIRSPVLRELRTQTAGSEISAGTNGRRVFEVPEAGDTPVGVDPGVVGFGYGLDPWPNSAWRLHELQFSGAPPPMPPRRFENKDFGHTFGFAMPPNPRQCYAVMREDTGGPTDIGRLIPYTDSASKERCYWFARAGEYDQHGKYLEVPGKDLVFVPVPGGNPGYPGSYIDCARVP